MAAPSLQQYLTAALSQRGPAALPYAVDVHGAIHQHLASLSYAFPAFRVSVSTFVHNDGRAATLLCAQGPLPLPASSSSSSSATAAASYAPVTIWLLEAYPRMPPVVLLSFPPGAAVKPRHPLVDPSGAVSIPYLRSWLFPYYNLIDLVRSLAHLFGQDPPLQKRVIVSSQPRIIKYDARTELINQLVRTVQRDITETSKTYERELEALLATQAQLKKRKEEIAQRTQMLEEEKEMLEQKLQIVCINCDVLRTWVAQSQSKDRMVKRLTVATCIDALELASARMRQVTECTAMDMAMEDVIYALDEALREGCVPLGSYLKSVRALAREQFFHRAMVAKRGSA